MTDNANAFNRELVLSHLDAAHDHFYKTRLPDWTDEMRPAADAILMLSSAIRRQNAEHAESAARYVSGLAAVYRLADDNDKEDQS